MTQQTLEDGLCNEEELWRSINHQLLYKHAGMTETDKVRAEFDAQLKRILGDTSEWDRVHLSNEHKELDDKKNVWLLGYLQDSNVGDRGLTVDLINSHKKLLECRETEGVETTTTDTMSEERRAAVQGVIAATVAAADLDDEQAVKEFEDKEDMLSYDPRLHFVYCFGDVVPITVQKTSLLSTSYEFPKDLNESRRGHGLPEKNLYPLSFWREWDRWKARWECKC